MRHMKNLTFTPEPIIAEQLQELSRITQRPVGDLISEIIAAPLNQMIEGEDTDLMRLVIGGVVYDDASQARAVAENYNALNRATVREHGQSHVCTARATDECTIEFTEPALVKV